MVESTADGSVRFPAPHASRLRHRDARSGSDRSPASSGFTAPCSSPTPASWRPGTRGEAVRLLETAGIETTPFHDFGAEPRQRDGRSGARASPQPLARRLDRRARRRQLARLREGDQLPADQRRQHRRLPRLRQGRHAAAADDRRADDGGHRERGAELRGRSPTRATHMKMACGDPSAAVRIALLDPELTLTAPRHVTAMAGLRRDRPRGRDRRDDCAGRRCRTRSRTRPGGCSSDAFERVLLHPADAEARAAMQLGAHFAGMAIEQSMLGAAHACANPLTARYDLRARPRARDSPPPRRPLERRRGAGSLRGAAQFAAPPRARRRCRRDARAAARRSRRRRRAGDDAVRQRRRGERAARASPPQAAQQWTGTFNPRPFDAAGALEIYRAAL